MLKPLKRLTCNPSISIKLKTWQQQWTKRGRAINYDWEMCWSYTSYIHRSSNPFIAIANSRNPTWTDHMPFQDQFSTPILFFYFDKHSSTHSLAVSTSIMDTSSPTNAHNCHQPLPLAPLLICLTIPSVLLYKLVVKLIGLNSFIWVYFWNQCTNEELILTEVTRLLKNQWTSP